MRPEVMNPRIQAAYDRVHKAERELHEAIRSTYQIGDTLCYERGNYEVAAEVLDHCDSRLKVRGLSSGKEYWIEAYSVI